VNLKNPPWAPRLNISRDDPELRDSEKVSGDEGWNGMPHVFQGFAPFLPQALEAIANIGEFIRQH